MAPLSVDMRRHTTALTGAECANCGNVGATKSGESLRCSECGRYASPKPEYCPDHEVDVSRLTGYDECPRCRQERDVRAREQEMHARRANPRMHTSVDAKRF